MVHWLTRPQRDVVQVNDVVVSTTIHQRTQFAVADGQRLLEILSLMVIPQTQRWLLFGGATPF